MGRRHDYFSLDEANATIPTLEYYFRQLLLLQRDLAVAQRTLLDGGATVGKEGVRLPRSAGPAARAWRERYRRLCDAYDHVMGAILDLGVEVVDPEAGMVNLHAWCDGEEVLLSWHYGEPAIRYWLAPGEPFAHRRPLRQRFADAPGPRAPLH